MASFIQQVENNESLLLMYLTGELPSEDRAEVEQMLAGDAGLRAELVRLESAYAFAMQELSELDSDQTTTAGENHAIRQVQRAMRQWQIDRSSSQPLPASVPRRKIPAWAYPSAAAAMLLIGTLTYWGIVGEPAAPQTAIKTDGPTTTDVIPNSNQGLTTVQSGSQTSEQNRDVRDVTAKADLLETSLGNNLLNVTIADAQASAQTLASGSDTPSTTFSNLLAEPQ